MMIDGSGEARTDDAACWRCGDFKLLDERSERWLIGEESMMRKW